MRDELYHQTIIELARRASRGERLAAPDVSVTVDNPLCGDRVTLDLVVADGRVRAIGEKVRGCLLCQAAAAVIAERAPGETAKALRTLAQDVARVIRRESATDDDPWPWPELAAFAPVRRHKSRHDCVLLPFEALSRALDQTDGR